MRYIIRICFLTEFVSEPFSVPSYIQVKFSMYLQYIRAMGWGYTITVFIVYFIQNIAFIGQNLWLSDWTNDAMRYNNSEYPASVRDTRVGVFGALGLAQGMLLVSLVI